MPQTSTRAYRPGHLVRLSDYLEAEWAAAHVAAAGAVEVITGRISFQAPDRDYCGTCDYRGESCAGPFYVVEGDEIVTIFGAAAVFAEHELRPDQPRPVTRPRVATHHLPA